MAPERPPLVLAVFCLSPAHTHRRYRVQHSGHEHDSEQEAIRPLPEGRLRQPRRQAEGPRQGHPGAGRRGRNGPGRAVVGIAQDPMRRDSDRLEASRLLADRGWGKAAAFEPVEGDPLGLEDVEQAAEAFRARILRLAGEAEQAPMPPR